MDGTIWAATSNLGYEELREKLVLFAELMKSPNQLHKYRMTPLSLWNAAAAGLSSEQVVRYLEENSRFEVPPMVTEFVHDYMNRYGLLRLLQIDGRLVLTSENGVLLRTLAAMDTFSSFITAVPHGLELEIEPRYRGLVKQECLRQGYPVLDEAGYTRGEAMPIQLKEGRNFELRGYQREAVAAFEHRGSLHAGSGVIVLPCGAGKTIVGIAAMAALGCATLILTSNTTSVRQWRRELLEKTDLPEDWIGEYSGSAKEVKPVTIATYQILTYRRSQAEPFVHMNLFSQRNWGLILYDEIHLLPAPVFRATAEIQATRRLGLTATLVREDGREEDVFSLVGPKCYEMAWKKLTEEGYIANVDCAEVLVPLADEKSSEYVTADQRKKSRIAAENPSKLECLEQILRRHEDEQVLIIGQYIEQLKRIAERVNAPIITGEVSHEEREKLYRAFRAQEIRKLVVSKVANFAVDLPDASVAVQVSGSFGSRQEEAQRLGRVLRPKRDGRTAYFYSLVTEHTKEQHYASKRQLFLVEQGYRYRMLHAGFFKEDCEE